MGKSKALSPKLRLNEELMEAICARLRVGHKIKDACLLEGITEHSYMAWRKRGKNDPDSIFGKFHLATDAARADARIAALEIVSAAAGLGRAPGDEMPSRVRREVIQYADGSRVTRVIEEREPAKWANEILRSGFPEDWSRTPRIKEDDAQDHSLNVVFVKPDGKPPPADTPQ